MSTLTVTLPEGASVVDGKQLTFVVPSNCNCADIEGIMIGDIKYELVDATNTCIQGKVNQFAPESMISVIIDTRNNRAYIQNSSNSVVVDEVLDHESVNAVSNKCVSAAIDDTKGYTDKKISEFGGFIANNTAPEQTNLLWIDTTDNTMKYHDGEKWTAVYGVFG